MNFPAPEEPPIYRNDVDRKTPGSVGASEMYYYVNRWNEPRVTNEIEVPMRDVLVQLCDGCVLRLIFRFLYETDPVSSRKKRCVCTIIQCVCTIIQCICMMIQGVCTMIQRVCTIIQRVRTIIQRLCTMIQCVCTMIQCICMMIQGVRTMIQRVCTIIQRVCEMGAVLMRDGPPRLI